ncbi:MAG: DUF1573 domain-containing protein [Planctomycetota bacterium]
MQESTSGTMSRRLVIVVVLLLLVAATATTVFFYARESSSADSFDPDSSELQCGHWSVYRVCQLLGVPVEKDQLLSALPRSSKGHSLQHIATVLNDNGITTAGFRKNWDTLQETAFPCIVHFQDPDHYVTVSGIEPENNYIHVYDGEGARVRLEREQFERRWSGITLCVKRDKQTNPNRIIDFEHLLVDKGDIPATGQITEFSFPFRNMSQEDLIIEEVQVSCSCLQSEKPKLPIRPGETGVIKLFYKVLPKTGAFLQTAVVKTNNPKSRYAVLTASGYSGVEVLVNPSQIVANDIVQGATRTIRLYLNYNGRWRDLEVSNLSANLKNAELIEMNSQVIDKQDAADVSLSNTDRASAETMKSKIRVIDFVIYPTGQLSDEVTGYVNFGTNITGYEHFKIDFTGKIVSAVKAMPEYVVFKKDEHAAVIEQTVRLVPRNRSELYKVIGVFSDGDVVDVKNYTTRDTDHGILISFRLPLETALDLSKKNVVVRLQNESTGKEVNCGLIFFAR